VEFYHAISCYVCATTCERAPFPTAEALLCGRPVVTTPVVDSPPEVRDAIDQGAGAVVADLATGIRHVQANFLSCAMAAQQFKLLDRAKLYEDKIMEVLGG